MSALRRLFVTLFIVLGLAAGAWYGWQTWDRSRDVQSTDDAYVHGEITAVSPRVAGYATAVTADDDETVAAKQVVVQIDPRDYKAAVVRAEAALGQSQATLGQAKAKLGLQQSQIAVAKAALDSAQAQALNAEVTLSRARDLFGKGSGTQVVFDNATAQNVASASALKQAQAQLDYQKQEVSVLEADVKVAEAQVASAEAALGTAKIALEDTGVWAPVAGTIANRATRVGEYVTVGTRMMSVVPKDGLWIEANFRETQLARMQPDQPVAITLDTFAKQHLCGYVESLGPASGSEFALVPADNATGNFTKIVRRFPVRIRPNGTDENAGLLRPGMSATVRVAEAGGAVDGCRFDAAKDRRARTLPTLPAHPGVNE